MIKLATTSNAIETYINCHQRYSKIPISQKAIDQMTEHLVVEEYAKGEYYCQQAMPTNKAGLLLEGSAKATTDELVNEAQVMKFFIVGDFISAGNPQEAELSDRNIIFTANSTVVSQYNLKTWFADLVNNFPELNNIVLAMYMEEIEKIKKISTMRSIPEARERILYYYTHFGHFDNYFSGRDIANFIGLQRETFSRNKAEVLRSL